MGYNILRRIEAFLKLADMPPSVFGRCAARDPRLVADLRNGREVGAKLRLKIESFIQDHQEKLAKGEAWQCGDRRTREGRQITNTMIFTAQAPHASDIRP